MGQPPAYLMVCLPCQGLLCCCCFCLALKLHFLFNVMFASLEPMFKGSSLNCLCLFLLVVRVNVNYGCFLLVVNGCCWLLELMLIYLRLEAFNVSGAKGAFMIA